MDNNDLKEFNTQDNQGQLNQNVGPKLNLNLNAKELKPNFTRKEIDAVEIPREIAKEIKFEKFRILGINLIGTISALVAIFFIALDVTKKDNWNFLNMNPDYIPNQIGMYFLLGFAIAALLFALVDYRHIMLDTKRYKSDILMGKETIPFFLLRNYKSLVSRPYYVNWISFSVYLFGGIIIGIMYAIRATTSKPLNTEIIIMISLIISTLILQILSLLFTRARKGNLNMYYGYEIVPFEEVKEIKKRANRTCLIVFFGILAVVLFVIIIPMMIIRKKSGKSLIPFI